MFEVTEPKPELRASKRFHCVRDVQHVARQFILYDPFIECNSSYGMWFRPKSENVSIWNGFRPGP